MKVEFFSHTDFMNQGVINPNLAEAKCLADIANRRLEREARRVYGVVHVSGESSWDSHLERSKMPAYTKTALLINIQDNQPCQHEPGKVRKRDDTILVRYECECGAKVEPSGFRKIE